MLGNKPVLIVRSRIDPAVMADFRRWYVSVHIPDVLTIPGIKSYRMVKNQPDGQTVTIYEFEDESVIQAALNSPQAAYTRGTWDQWRERLQELSVEIYAILAPSPSYRHWN